MIKRYKVEKKMKQTKKGKKRTDQINRGFSIAESWKRSG